jgi:CBS domain containing-hemolysin-like protein
MGSSGSAAGWVVLASLSGLLYLLFDAARNFAQQLGPVRLRRISGEPQFEGNARWAHYDAEDFHVVSGSLLQLALVVAVGSTIMTGVGGSLGGNVAAAMLLWALITIVWKFLLALIPDDVSERLLRALIPFSRFFYYVFWPLLYPLRSLLARIDRESEEADQNEEVTDEEVQAYIDVGEEEGIIEPSEGRLLQSVFEFGDRVAREIMTPRIDMLAFDAKWPLEELAKMFSESKYSRIPTYHESIDQIDGIVHIKEMFDAVLKGYPKTIKDLARPPYFVSETKKVSELLREFQSEHIQLAVVVDEFGGTAGIVTIEDIIEEIVGDISDEHEDEEATIVDIGDGTFLVSGLLRVQELEEMLGAEFSGEHYETVAGLIFTTLGRVPAGGTAIVKNGFRFTVERADRRRIYRVRVSREAVSEDDETIRQ